MKMRKAIKNIMALGTGLTMLGATVFGAVAADLGTYPDQYIQEGKFDGLMVVGATAKTDDVLGIVDIATSLQFSAKKVVGDSTTTTEISGDAYMFESNANILEIGEFVRDVKSTLTDEELESLKTTTIRNSKGTTDVDQYLKFDESGEESTLKVVYEKNDEASPDVVGDFLKLSSGDSIYTYEVQFPDGLESDLDGSELEDIEDETLYILGEEFSIVKGELDADGDIKLTLMGGSVTDTLKEGETRTYEVDGKEYEVTVVIVADSGVDDVKTKLMINGEVTKALEDGDTDTLDDGTVIGIRDVLANEGAEEGGEDIVSFYIGANKVVLDDQGNDVEIDEESISDAWVEIGSSNSSTTATIDYIKYRLDSDDDYYIEEGEGLSEVLDEPEGMLSRTWDIMYAGLSEPSMTTVKFNPSGDDTYKLEFVSQEGIEYSIPLVENNESAFNVGTDDKDLVYTEASETPSAHSDVATDGFITEDDYFIVGLDAADSNADVANTRVFQFTDIDNDDGELTLNDEGTGSSTTMRFDTLSTDTCEETKSELSAGGQSYTTYVCYDGTSELSLAVDLNGDGWDGENVSITTQYGAVLNFTSVTEGDPSSEPANLTMDLIIDGDYTDSSTQVVAITIDGDASDKDEVDLSVADGTPTSSLDMDSDEDSDDSKGMTKYGIKVLRKDDDDGADTLTFDIPSEQVGAQVYVTGGEAEATTTTGGDVATEVQRIEVGKSVLDSEVTDVAAQNIISVGGPCVNTVSATLLGISSDMPVCYEEFPVEEGEGIIKMVENGENVATIVAGYSAADTRNAAQVLANYQDYAEDLEDKEEVVVSGTQISVPVAEEEEEAPAEDAGNETTEDAGNETTEE